MGSHNMNYQLRNAPAASVWLSEKIKDSPLTYARGSGTSATPPSGIIVWQWLNAASPATVYLWDGNESTPGYVAVATVDTIAADANEGLPTLARDTATTDPLTIADNAGYLMLIDGDEATASVPLPAAVNGKQIFLALNRNCDVTITPDGAETIDGLSSCTLLQASGDFISLIGVTGVGWIVGIKKLRNSVILGTLTANDSITSTTGAIVGKKPIAEMPLTGTPAALTDGILNQVHVCTGTGPFTLSLPEIPDGSDLQNGAWVTFINQTGANLTLTPSGTNYIDGAADPFVIADGKSATLICASYFGSSTWNTSQGPAGADGADGANGSNGAPGAPGAPGADGLDGFQWADVVSSDGSSPLDNTYFDKLVSVQGQHGAVIITLPLSSAENLGHKIGIYDPGTTTELMFMGANGESTPFAVQPINGSTDPLDILTGDLACRHFVFTSLGDGWAVESRDVPAVDTSKYQYTGGLGGMGTTTLSASDMGKIVVLNPSGSTVLNLPEIDYDVHGKTIRLMLVTSEVITITPAGGQTIDGEATNEELATAWDTMHLGTYADNGAPVNYSWVILSKKISPSGT